MARVLVSFLVSTSGNLTQSLLDLFTQPPCDEHYNKQIICYSPEDNVFEEFDSSSGSWKAKRGSVWRSFVRSLWISLQIAFLSTVCIGLVAVFIIIVQILINSKCDLPKRLEVTYHAVEVLFLYFWHPLLLLNVFRGQFLREANVFSTSLVGALLDIATRFIIVLFGAYEPPWNHLVGNFVYTTIILINSYSIGRKLCPKDKKQAAKVAFKFGAQYIMGAPAFFLILYVMVPAFVKQQDNVSRMILLGLAMITAFPMKVISRYCALSLEGINHPGNSCLLVAVAYGSSIILFRIMQAEVEGFATFICLSLVHGVFHLVEVLMIKVEGFFSNKLRQCCGNGKILSEDYDSTTRDEEENGAGLGDELAEHEQDTRAHARLQRFLADTTILGMLFETTALILSVSIMQLYGIINLTSIEETRTMAKELVKRIYTGVFIEFVFNVCRVLILTRHMNIPILRVWKVRWKSHVTVFIIITVMSLLFFPDDMIDIVKMNLIAEGFVIADANCSTLDSAGT